MTKDFRHTYPEEEASRIAGVINNKLGDVGVYVCANPNGDNAFSKQPLSATLVVVEPSLQYSQYSSTLKSNRAYIQSVLQVLQDEGIIKSSSQMTYVDHRLSGLNIFDEDPASKKAFLFQLQSPLDEEKMNDALDKAHQKAEALIQNQEKAIPLLAALGINAKPAMHPNSGHNGDKDEPMLGLLEVKLSGNMGYGHNSLNEQGVKDLTLLKRLEEQGILTVEQWAQRCYAHIQDIDKLQEFCSQPRHLPDRPSNRQRG